MMTKRQFKKAIVEATKQLMSRDPDKSGDLEDLLVWREAVRSAIQVHEDSSISDIADLFVNGVTKVTPKNWFNDLSDMYDWMKNESSEDDFEDWMRSVIDHFGGNR